MANESNGRSAFVQGRIVWTAGSIFAGRKKLDQNTGLPRHNARGEEMMEYGFGLAVPKSVIQPNMMGPGQPGEFWAAMHEEAFTLLPHARATGQIPQGFAMKYKDGDGVDHNGVPFSQREGHAGCIILALTTTIPIKFFKFENGTNVQIADGIKCGDYVNVQVSWKAHPAVGTSRAGLYANPNAVQFMGHGKEIVNAPSGDQLFGVQAPALPAGASATPLAPPTTGIPGFAQPPSMPAMGQPPQAPQATPHYGVMPPAHQPPVGGSQAYPPQMGPPPTPQTYAAPQGVPPAMGGYHQPPHQPVAYPQGNGVMPAMPQQPAMPGPAMNHGGTPQYGQPAQQIAYPSNQPAMPPYGMPQPQ